jgi:hypothetical protein
MLYDSPEELDHRLGEGLVLFSGAVFVSKGDHTVMARQDVVFTDNPAKLKLDTQNNKLPNHSQINKQKVTGMFSYLKPVQNISYVLHYPR